MYKIMLVEDEAPLLRSMNRLIESLNLELQICAAETNGIQALTKCKQLHPDILL